MRMAAHQVEEWLSRNRRRIISCPYQPGNLRITLSGCRRRRLQARREDFTDMMKGDYFDYVYKNGLLRCRDCRIAGNGTRRSARAKSLSVGHEEAA